MNKKRTHFLFSLIVVILFCSCKSQQDAKSVTSSIIKHPVLNREEQQVLTPDEVIKEFKEGNERFRTSNSTIREHSETIRKAATGGQSPKAMVLSCIDSRVPVEDVFDQGIGDVFVGRVAGNFVNTDLLGSMEFACKVAGAKLIVVMGHQHCGAIKGAIDDVKLGNITAMLQNIKPAVAMSQGFNGDKSSKNEAFVKTVNKNNILNTISQIREKSEILRDMEAKGEIKIVGVFYVLRTGEIEFLK